MPNIPHLRNVKLTVAYREAIENDALMLVWRAPQKWKQDPDANRFGGFFGPRNQYFVNGVMVDEDKPKMSETSPTPFPEKQVPRRGLLQVFPGDPDFVKLCLEQGLNHLINGHQEDSVPNGVHSPPASHVAGAPNGNGPSTISDSNTNNHDTNGPKSHAHLNGTVLNGIHSSNV